MTSAVATIATAITIAVAIAVAIRVGGTERACGWNYYSWRSWPNGAGWVGTKHRNSRAVFGTAKRYHVLADLEC
jgi:hypothetical protein